MKRSRGKLQKVEGDPRGPEAPAGEGLAVDQAAPDRKQRVRRLGGRKYIKLLEKYLGSLRRTHEHHNRTLYYDDIVTLLLLGFFNSKVRSLRLLELCSEVPGVRQHLREDRICRSTLSEGLKLFDPQSLMPLIRKLYRALPRKPDVEPEFEELYEKLVAFDGSYFHVPAEVFWALREKDRSQVEGRQVRLNLHYCVSNGNPLGMSISGEGGLSEAQAIFKDVEPGLVYIGDRGVFSYAGVRAIVEGGADFVFRLQKGVGFTCEQASALSHEDQSHCIISDRQGHLTGSNKHKPPETAVREIIITNPDNPAEPIRLLTNMLHVPAKVVGDMYRCRWRIELFFRWLKVYANFEHMISHSKRGVETWFYVAFIGTLLMSLYTGHEPSTYTFAAMQLIISGQATYEDLAPALARREREKMLARQRRAAKKAAKKNA